MGMFKKLQHMDDTVLDKIARLHSPASNRIMAIITSLGNMGLIWFAICLPFFINKNWRMTGVNIVLGLCIAHLMGEILLKHIVCRERPCHKIDDEEQIINRPKYYSFPSGHTTASFSVVAVTMLRCTANIWIPILVLAILIGFSRVYLRVHYLTDVLVGVALGLVCGSSSVALLNYLTFNFFR